MFPAILPHTIAFAGASLIATCLAVMIAARPRKPGGLWMIAALLAAAMHCFGAAVEAQVLGEADKVFWSKVEYIGYTPCAFCLFGFTVRYLGLAGGLRRGAWLALGSVPVATLGLTWTNQWHWWIWSGFSPGPLENNVLVYHHGPAFWVFLAYTYVLSIVSAGLVWRARSQSHGVHRSQLGMIVAGIVFPMLTSALYALGWTPVRGLDTSPLGFLGSVAVVAWSLEHYHLLDLVPAAREAMVEVVPDAMLVFDEKDRLVDVNSAAAKLLGVVPGRLIGQAARLVLAPWPEAPRLLKNRESDQPECVDITLAGRTYEARTLPLREKLGAQRGWLLILRDVTEARRASVEREQLIGQLQQALAQVKTLSGLLPICAGCKRIRDDAGYWSQIETYISDHSEAKFTHGLCPECTLKYFPGIGPMPAEKAPAGKPTPSRS